MVPLYGSSLDPKEAAAGLVQNDALLPAFCSDWIIFSPQLRQRLFGSVQGGLGLVLPAFGAQPSASAALKRTNESP